MTIHNFSKTRALALAFGIAAAAAGFAQSPVVGAVYALSNNPYGNSVYAYARHDDGSLEILANVRTGGLGNGAGGGNLGSQGALQVSPDHKWVVAVNAGSNSVSVLKVTPRGLKLASVVDSHGTMPTSVTIHGNWVYVLNATSVNIAGFRLDDDGMASSIPGSDLGLSSAAAVGAEVKFDPAGDMLAVTEKNGNISTYQVDWRGRAWGPNVWASSGATPFGFTWGNRNQLLVTEAEGGAAGAGTVSSYRTNELGDVTLATGSLAYGQTSPCWMAATPDGHFVFAANTPASTITGFAVARDGTLSAIDPSGVSAQTGAGFLPFDMTVSADGHFLYALDRGSRAAISIFWISKSGHLRNLGKVPGLPTTSFGIDGF